MPGPNQDADTYGIPRGEATPPQHLLDEYNRIRLQVDKLYRCDTGVVIETEELAQTVLTTHAGLNLDTVHGVDTPKRFVSMLEELTQCKNCDGNCIKWKTFVSDVDQMVVVNRIPFASVCNHHVVPFVGHAWIGYVPDGAVAGLSKFARVVHHFARRLQVQEDLTDQIAYFLEKELVPKGVIVVMEAEHLCMTIRGVQTPGTTTRTVVTKGVFADHSRTAKAEFLMGIK
jgi:GTP cyclohydrolase I